MKSIIYMSFVFMFFLTTVSCKKESVISSDSKSLNSQFKELVNTPQREENSITDMSKPFMTKIDTKKLNLLNAMNSQSDQPQMRSIGTINPPGRYDWTSHFITATKVVTKTDYQILINSSQVPGLATGYYICDVYTFNANPAVPASAATRLDLSSMPKYGYNSYSQLIRGVNYVQTQSSTGSTFYMSTYSILIKRSMSGQYINKLMPYDLTGMQFAYSTFL